MSEMIIATIVEKQRREKKGYAFHCMITDTHEKALLCYQSAQNPLGKCVIQNETQLEFVLKKLLLSFHKKELNNLSSLKYRVQLLIHNSTHWTAVDIEFQKDKNQVLFFIMDAANDPKWRIVKEDIQKIFPEALIFICAGEIQSDYENCSAFALHHIFQSSKITDLFEYLLSKKGKCVKNADNTYSLTMFDLPPQLVMTTQGAKRLLNTYFSSNSHLSTYLIKNQPFNEFILKYSKKIQVPNEDKISMVNQYVLHFRKKQKVLIKNYVSNASEQLLSKLIPFNIQIVLGDMRKNQLDHYKKHQAMGIMLASN